VQTTQRQGTPEEIEMPKFGRTSSCTIHSIAATALLFAGLGAAGPYAAAQAKPAVTTAAAAGVVSDSDMAAIQDQLIKLLRLSPTLTTVVEHDPSLLSNQEYVARNNPQLAQFLQLHPEVARNPEGYLFNHLDGEPGHRDEALERAVWPELTQPWRAPSPLSEIANDVVPFLVFVGVLAAVLWLFHQVMENRRWSRIFKLQTEVHNKLIDKFGSSQELLTYMDTEAGKRFLEAAPIPVGFGPEQRMPNAVARVLNPLQIGVVLTLLGIGLLALRNQLGVEMRAPMLLMGTVVLMPGIGFILSAGITWVLAGRLGLMPEAGDGSSRSNGLRERQ
jgi:hypothetical protein